MLFTSPGQIFCNICGLNIYYYGIILAIAICTGVIFSDWIGIKYFNLKKETIIDLAPYLIIFGIIGARLYYCILDYNFYLRFPTEIFALRHGGISIHGAIFGGIIGLIIFAKKHKLSVFNLMDVCAVSLPLSQAIGRWGNFFNSEAYGTPTNLPWGLYISPSYRQIPYLDYEFFHPAFLYESILDLIIFFILLFLVSKQKLKKSGQLTLYYLILYSLARILVEMCRIDSVKYIFNIPVAILMSVGIIIVSLFLLLKSFNCNKKEEE